MRTRRLAAVLLLLGTGCGGSDLSARILTACTRDGGMDEAQCKCIADRAEKDLSKGAQELVLAQIEEDHDRVEELSKQMSLQDAASVGTFMMNASSRCATESTD
jgi:hypothetical protein